VINRVIVTSGVDYSTFYATMPFSFRIAPKADWKLPSMNPIILALSCMMRVVHRGRLLHVLGETGF